MGLHGMDSCYVIVAFETSFYGQCYESRGEK